MTFKIGFLVPTTLKVWEPYTRMFEAQLETHGWLIGKDVTIEYQQADGRTQLYDDFAENFVEEPVDIIVTGGTGAAHACKKATNPHPIPAKPIPVVFATAGDPVNCGLVASLDKPGGNVTGISNQQSNLVIKRMNYMRDNLKADWGPNFHVGGIGNGDSPNVNLEMKFAADVAKDLGLKFDSDVTATSHNNMRSAFQNLKNLGVKALFVSTDPLITTYAEELNKLALDAKIATMHAFRVNHGETGLMFYGPCFTNIFQRAADFVYEILNVGTSPADIPVEEAQTFEKECRKKTAEILGLKSLVATL
jgi:putative ABC transport system substrate-binding protein